MTAARVHVAGPSEAPIRRGEAICGSPAAVGAVVVYHPETVFAPGLFLCPTCGGGLNETRKEQRS